MTDEQKAAYINAMVACATITAAGMTAANSQAILDQKEPPYKKADFDALIEEYGIHHNAVLTTLQR